MLEAFKGDTPKARRNRMLAALGIGAALALVVLIRRRAGMEAPAAASASPSSPLEPQEAMMAAGGPPFPTTFADNAALTSNLTDALVVGLGDVSSALGQVPGQVGQQAGAAVSEAIAASPLLAAIGQPAAGGAPVPAPAPPAPMPAPPAPKPKPAPQPQLKPNVFYSEDRRLRYVVDRRRSPKTGRQQSYRLYESGLNKGDWGSRGDLVIPV
jgi:hypothetical protein